MSKDDIKPGEQLTLAQINRLRKQAQSTPAAGNGSGGNSDVDLRQDGPTVEQYVAEGYKAANYPPKGYASRSTQEEIDAAINVQKETDPLKMKVDDLKAWLTAKGIAFEASAKKEELQALVPKE